MSDYRHPGATAGLADVVSDSALGRHSAHEPRGTCLACCWLKHCKGKHPDILSHMVLIDRFYNSLHYIFLIEHY